MVANVAPRPDWRPPPPNGLRYAHGGVTAVIMTYKDEARAHRARKMIAALARLNEEEEEEEEEEETDDSSHNDDKDDCSSISGDDGEGDGALSAPRLRVVLDGQMRIRAGETITLAVDAGNIHVFNAQTERAIRD